MRFALIFLILLGAGGCSLGFQYEQCHTNEDCAAFQGQPFCTDDHICVPEEPLTSVCGFRHPMAEPPNAIQIGALLDLTEGSADRARLRALTLGVEEVNEQSRFNRAIRPIGLSVCNTAGALAKGDSKRKAAMERLLTHLARERRVVGIIGPTTNQLVQDIATVAIAEQVPILTPSAASAALGELSQGYIFRLMPTENLQAQKLAQSSSDFPNHNPPTNPVLLTLASVQSDYGESLRQTFQDKWDDRNQGNVPTSTPTFPESLDAKDKVTATAMSILAQEPPPTHVLLIIDRSAQPHALTLLGILKGLKTFGTMKPTKIWVTDGAMASNLLPMVTDPEFQGLVKNLEGIVPQALDRGPMGNKLTQTASEFRANMLTQQQIAVEPETGDYDFSIGYTYDAFYALALAAESVRGEEASGPKVATALRRFKSNKPDKTFAIGPGSFGAFNIGVNNLQAGGEVAMNGVTGTVRFSPQGDREPALFERWKMEEVTVGMPGMGMKKAQFTLKVFQ